MAKAKFRFYDAFGKCPKLASDGFHNIVLLDYFPEDILHTGICTWCGGSVRLTYRELELLDIRAEQRRAYQRGKPTQQH